MTPKKLPLPKRTLGIVLAHGGARPTVERHLPVWRDNAATIVAFTPLDDCVGLPGLPEYSVGRSASYSPHTNQRTREALRFAAMTSFDFVLLIEYDSLIFGPIPEKFYPTGTGVTAAQFIDKPGDKFKGSQYLHFPVLMTRKACSEIVDFMDVLPLHAEAGFTDRYVGYAAELAGVKVNDLNPTGFVYTRNLIEPKDLPEATAAIQKGARWHHGIKSKEVFDAMLAATQPGAIAIPAPKKDPLA